MNTTIYIVPDLALLVCDPDLQPYDDSFRNLVEDVLIALHDERGVRALKSRCAQLSKYGFQIQIQWAISDDLAKRIWNEYPYIWIGKPGFEWVADLLKVLDPFLRENNIPVFPTDQQTFITCQTPNFFPDYIERQHNIRQHWLRLTAACFQPNTNTSIASHPETPNQIEIVITIQNEDNNENHSIPLIREIDEWEDLQQQFDPWYKNNLPFDGECFYRPPAYWHPGSPFPGSNEGRQPNFVDEKSRRWEWDRNETHWDVQEPHSNKYRRVTPDGKILD